MVRPVRATRGAVARGLVHLAVDQGHLVEYVRLRHLVIEVVTFAGALADACEHRVARVLDGDVADQLHEGDGLADAGATEQPDLAALDDGHDQVDDLDSGLEDLGGGGLIFELGRDAVDGPTLFGRHLAFLIHRLAEDVHDAAERGGADGHADGRPRTLRLQATPQPIGRAHRDGADYAVA